jgi:hypothetical protein
MFNPFFSSGFYLAEHMACSITLGIPLSRALTLQLIQCFVYTVEICPYNLDKK